MNKLWKEAASIIIAGRSKVFNNTKILFKINEKYRTPDYKILVLKRGKSSRFFPGGYVFPGGTVEEADGCQEWLNLFESQGFKTEYLNSIVTSSPKVPLFADSGTSLHKSLSLRITAIRETFEESGILLCKSKKCSSSPLSNWASFLISHELQKWQKIVQNNPKDFLNLCKEFECVPDVWALHQWSNWMTPTNNPIRFDTAFFLVTIDQLPPSFMNESEMDDIKWYTPDELLRGNLEDTCSLPPPQYYEISRLYIHQNIEQLNNYAVQRSSHGLVRWLAIQKKADDGILFILPGDDLYPEDVDCNIKDKMGVIDGTLENLRKRVKKLHRMELFENQGTKIFVSNIEPTCGHVLPTHEQHSKL